MAKVTLIQVVYNSKKFIEPVFSSIFSQTYKDFKVVAVISGNQDGSKELIAEKFSQVEIVDPGFNIGFAKGHNIIFEKGESDYYQLVNPDLILKPDFLENMLGGFSDPKVGVISGKLLHYDFEKNQQTNLIDSTGVTMSRGGRGRDRGQHEIDSGQYDNKINLIAASGAGMCLSHKALEAIKFKESGGHWQYFDEGFHSYWEDVDLTWRMVNGGFKCIYMPNAVAFHGRAAASSAGGYIRVLSFIKHHSKISQRIKELNFKNHIYLFIKNSPRLYPQFFVREFFMWLYILVFETSTFRAVPKLFRDLPKIWKQRKEIQAKRQISIAELEKLMV